MIDKLKEAWDTVQDFLDVDGDAMMAIYTTAVVWKTLHVGLNAADAAAYASAIAAFGYSNTNRPKQS